MDSFPQFEGISSHFHLIDPAEMQYYLNDNNKSRTIRKVPLCIAAAVYRISAGNCMPYSGATNNPNAPPTAHQRTDSPWDSYRQRYKKLEDSSSCSTLESTCSSRSDSPEPKHAHPSPKKRSHHMLLREIRRLRGENSFLRSTVSVLKNDLRDSHLSRQNADIIHQRISQEYDSRYKSLEQEMLEKSDLIESLKEQIEQLQLSACSSSSGIHTMKPTPYHHDNEDPAYVKQKSTNNFGCFEFEQDDEGMSCQPMAQESALPEVEIKMDELKTDGFSEYLRRRFNEGQDDNDDDEEVEEDRVDPDLEPFEEAAPSYIRQAIVAKLSSARVRLDFDDLIVKHEPSNDTIMSVLADAFVYWLYTQWTKSEETSTQKIFQNQIQHGIDDFWKSILQCYTVDDDCQVSLLHYIEDAVKEAGCPALVNHFDRIIIFLFKYEVIEEEAVVSWHTNPVNDDEQSRNIRLVSKHFIEYIEDSGEEDSDEEDDDDESINFEFMDSTIPDDDSIDFAFEEEDEEDDEEENLHDSIEDLLSVKERNPCICQFNYDNDTSSESSATLPLPPSPSPPSPSFATSGHKHELPECSCDSTYNTPPATEKKKKSVRIAM